MTYIFLVLLSVAMFSTGQVLFKIAAMSLKGKIGSVEWICSFANFHMIVALGIYGVGTLLWVYLLSLSNLSKLYPFVSLSFVVVPILSYLIFKETVSVTYLVGVTLILIGVGITSYTN